MIVVGIDGSESAHAALVWALGEARARHDDVHVISAWHVPPAAFAPGFAPAIDGGVDAWLKDGAEHTMARTLDEVSAEADGISVTRSVVQGMPAQVLVEAAAGAELLVVGSRGHGGFAGLLLGSVSQHCAQHASCPVVIVRNGVPLTPVPGEDA